MNKLLIATTAAVALATVGTAGAADLPVKAPPMVAAVPVASWTGCYVSGGIGYGMWNQDHHIAVTGVPQVFNGTTVQLTADETSGGRGWLGRVGVGCDYQASPQFVIGAFADYDFMNLRTHDFGNLGMIFGAEEKESASWAVGGRLGYLPYPNLLTFVSGGWTQARFDAQNIFVTINPAVAIPGLTIGQHTYSGWFLGGGTEYRLPFAQNLTWKTEYRFNQYRADDLPWLFNGVTLPIVEHNQKFVQTVTTSLVWRFDFGGPVVARY
jgi:outer membrane immunogenic protein